MQKNALCKWPLRLSQMSCKDIKIVSCLPKILYSKKQVWQMQVWPRTWRVANWDLVWIAFTPAANLKTASTPSKQPKLQWWTHWAWGLQQKLSKFNLFLLTNVYCITLTESNGGLKNFWHDLKKSHLLHHATKHWFEWNYCEKATLLYM